jgi:adenylate kinase family enzyme
MNNKNNIIIHICGPSGSGKSTLGNKLKDKFKNKIVVKDIDVLRYEFIKNFYGNKKWSVFDKDAYQKYIDDYIHKIKKPLIFVGLNNMPWWHKNHYYNLYADYNFYIKLDNETIIKQKCTRLFKNLANIENEKEEMNDLINNNKKFIELITNAIKNECDLKKIIKMNNKWNKDYKNQDYTFMSRLDIYKQVCKLLSSSV